MTLHQRDNIGDTHYIVLVGIWLKTQDQLEGKDQLDPTSTMDNKKLT